MPVNENTNNPKMKSKEVINTHPTYVCPICGDHFLSLENYSKHITNHVETEKKEKIKAEMKKQDEMKIADITAIKKLYEKRMELDKQIKEAVQSYKSKYGGAIIPYGVLSYPVSLLVRDFF